MTCRPHTVTVSELLAAGEPVMTATCYDSRPGDRDHHPPIPMSNRPFEGLTAHAGRTPAFAWPWLAGAATSAGTTAAARNR
jgi:hypothetical protein